MSALFPANKIDKPSSAGKDVVQQPVLIPARSSILKPGGSVTLGPAFFYDADRVARYTQA